MTWEEFPSRSSKKMLTQAQYHAKYYETKLKVGDRVDHVNGGYGQGEGYVSRLGTVTAITHTKSGVNVTVAHDQCGTCEWEAYAMRPSTEMRKA